MPITKFTPTFNLEQERIEALKQLIPETVSDGKIEWEVLKEALGEFAEEEGAEPEVLNVKKRGSPGFMV
ncbi:hypothetical protein LQF76_02510 [Gloeomargaritales cyanobacterium VI4D9]|nr:hypothetical protein LQF76_02510 [Gloeomargaritales cyanobacterium VI4D9]